MRLLAVLLGFLAFGSIASAQTTVRVLLAETSSYSFAVPEAHRGFADGRELFSARLPLDWPVTASGEQVVIDGRPVGHTFAITTASGTVTHDGRTYRGALVFTARESSLLVINQLDLEDYLRGVVPSEMQASWPDDALQAQAIAARSYTLNELDPDGLFDICATDSCQVYRGTETEHPRSDAAITATRGLVLTHGGTFARTYYHSDSGGVVASAAEVWGTPLSYLPGGTDILVTTPHRQWTRTLSPGLVTAAVQNSGRNVGTVSSMTVTAYSESGRVHSLRVNGSAGSTTYEGALATAFLRGLGLKSTRLVSTGPLSVRGDGWGHGVGMSQYGAMSMASNGYRYDQILAFYYPGTQLSRLTFTGQER